jgi:predicted cupin superfamily sugar epimerase
MTQGGFMDTDKKSEAAFWIKKLGLEPHAEGGWYREVWQAGLTIPQNALPAEYADSRSACSSIYYLLQGDECSTWHRVRSAEIWLWHAGGTLELKLGGGNATPKTEDIRLLGPNGDKDETFQFVVEPNVWQGAKIHQGNFVLVSCIVSPGFHWQDFSLPQE